jgi:hypothetical protein
MFVELGMGDCRRHHLGVVLRSGGSAMSRRTLACAVIAGSFCLGLAIHAFSGGSSPTAFLIPGADTPVVEFFLA